MGFTMDREPGKEILEVENLTKTIDGVKVLDHVSFRLNRGDKVGFVGENEIAVTTLFQILMEEIEPDEGRFKWGISTSRSYFPKDNSAYFDGCKLSILDGSVSMPRRNPWIAICGDFWARCCFLETMC